MYKSGLIMAGAALVLTIGATLLSPLVVVCCLTPLLGLAAGYLAGVFDKPGDNNTSVKNGAIAGAIAGAGALVGQMIGAVLNGFIVGPQGAADLTRELGLPVNGPVGPGGYWVGILGGGCCFGIIDVLLIAGLAALGGLLWWQMTGKNAVAAPEEVIDVPKEE